jgi:hypothetical protein
MAANDLNQLPPEKVREISDSVFEEYWRVNEKVRKKLECSIF